MAGLFFRKHRTVAISPFVADTDPNVSQPVKANIFETADRASMGDFTQGHYAYFVFKAAGVEITTPDCSFTTWIQNENDGSWSSLTPETLVPHRRIYGVDIYGDAFVQVTAVNDGGGTADTLEIWMSESGEL